ncbi:microbial aspartic proteinase [Thozetella sp. PMI_491]|nr:microbial aspartic proteinase [Thozetella sp. PMI_491]
MTFSQILVAAIAGSSLVSAAPGLNIGTANNVGPGRTSIKQVRNPNYKFNPSVSLYKTQLKYGRKPSDSLKAKVESLRGSLGRRTTGSVDATPIDSVDDAYICPVQIGTPAQTLNLDFDTGSSDLWVFSSSTASSEVNGQALYKPASSSTSSRVSGATWSIVYGDQSTSSGIVFTDKVTIGGLTVSSQQVEAAQQVSSTFTRDSVTDGLVGLGFDNINTVLPTKAKTFFSNIKSQLDSPVFTVDLKHQEEGTYDFGFIDSSKYTGSLTYTPVSTANGWWQFTSSGYQIGSKAFTSTSFTGIADTGTTLLFLPSSLVTSYYRGLSGSVTDDEGLWYYRCALTPPSITFGVGSSRFTIPSSLMNMGVADDEGEFCAGGLQDNALTGISIFGDVALKATFVVFDGSSSPRLGWASKTV